MTILTERRSWSRHRPQNETKRSSDLTPTEQANVRAALSFLRVRFGTMRKLAEAMKAQKTTVSFALNPKRAVTAGIALRVARVAGVPLEEVLTGRWPALGACPHCGRCPDGQVPAPSNGGKLGRDE